MRTCTHPKTKNRPYHGFRRVSVKRRAGAGFGVGVGVSLSLFFLNFFYFQHHRSFVGQITIKANIKKLM